MHPLVSDMTAKVLAEELRRQAAAQRRARAMTPHRERPAAWRRGLTRLALALACAADPRGCAPPGSASSRGPAPALRSC